MSEYELIGMRGRLRLFESLLEDADMLLASYATDCKSRGLRGRQHFLADEIKALRAELEEVFGRVFGDFEALLEAQRRQASATVGVRNG
jgi:hypothetical protein